MRVRHGSMQKEGKKFGSSREIRSTNNYMYDVVTKIAVCG